MYHLINPQFPTANSSEASWESIPTIDPSKASLKLIDRGMKKFKVSYLPEGQVNVI